MKESIYNNISSMNYHAQSFHDLIEIAHHHFATLYQNKTTGEKSLHASAAINAGSIFGTFEAAATLTTPNRYTLQMSENTHIILSPDVLQYVNHSCNPNIFFDTTTYELVALRTIARGDELAFFYPSTEWAMESPFNCHCGDAHCLHLIQGASFLSPETIARHRFSDFISKKLKIPHLQIV